MIRSLVSIPDVHGDLARLQSAFQLANLTDSRNAWRAPAGTVVVQTGDLVDRGDEIQGIVAFLQAMEDQAAAAGSVLHRLLGNHEIMNLMGDLRYVTRGDLASFGGHAAEPAAATRPSLPGPRGPEAYEVEAVEVEAAEVEAAVNDKKETPTNGVEGTIK